MAIEPPALPSGPPRPLRSVVVVAAMEIEAAPLREAFGTVDDPGPPWAAALPCRLARTDSGAAGPDVVIAANGVDPFSNVDAIGTTAAGLTTLVGLAALPTPDLVLSVGTAGGWGRAGAEIGDVYVAWPRIVCHDRRIALPGFDALGEANLPAADLRSAAEGAGCRFGIVTTGDSLDESDVDRARIERSGAEVKEMEAAAVAWVAHLHGIPVSAVKAITDLVDSPVATEEQFATNLHTATTALAETTVELVGRLARATA